MQIPRKLPGLCVNPLGIKCLSCFKFKDFSQNFFESYIYLNYVYKAYWQELQNPVYCVQVVLKYIWKVFVIRCLIKETSCLALTWHCQIHSPPRNLLVRLNKYKDPRAACGLWGKFTKWNPSRDWAFFSLISKGIFKSWLSEKTTGSVLKDSRLSSVPVPWRVDGKWRALAINTQSTRAHPHWTLPCGLVYLKHDMFNKHEKLSSGRAYFIFLSFIGPNDIKLHKISITTKWKV